MVAVKDKDLRSGIMFMVSLATIIEEMMCDMIANPHNRNLNYKKYSKNLRKFKPTLDGMVEDFEESIFDTHFNRRNKEHFIELLAYEG